MASLHVAGAPVSSLASNNWCYLLNNFLPEQKINTHIGLSENPYISLHLHNEGKIKGSKRNKNALGNWILEMIIGPFTQEQGIDFTDQWKKKSRGIESRRNRGETLACQFNLKCYDRKIK